MSGFLSWLYGGNKTQEPTVASGLNIQSSSQGYPVPILYGKTKSTSNLIWYGNFRAIRNETKVGKGGGQTIVNYTYTVGVMFGQCEGKLISYSAAWTPSGMTTVQALGFTEFYGTPNQAPWSFLSGYQPAAALNYKNFAYLANSTFNLGNQPYLPQIWFELNGTTPIVDYQPDTVFHDALYNPVVNEFWTRIIPTPSNTLTIKRYSGTDTSFLGNLTLTNYFSSGKNYGSVSVYYDYDEVCVWAFAYTTLVYGAEIETCLYKLNASTGAEITHRLWTLSGDAATVTMTQGQDPKGGYKGQKGALTVKYTRGLYTPVFDSILQLNKSTLATESTITASGFSFPLTTADYKYVDNAGYGWGINNSGATYFLIKWDYTAHTATKVFTFDTNCRLMGLDPTRNNLVIAGQHYGMGGIYLFNTATLTYGAQLTPNQDVGNHYGDLSVYDSNRDWFWYTGYADGTYQTAYTAFNLATNTQAFYIQTPLSDDYYPYILAVDDTYPYIWAEQNDFGSNYFERIYPEFTGDEAPAYVIEDFLTNPRYGAGFPASRLDSISLKNSPSSYANYTNSQLIGFSMLINQPSPARDQLSRWLLVTNTAAFWSDGLLKFAPFGDVSISGNGTNYVPNNTVQYQLTDNDFVISGGDDPITVTRPDAYDCYNSYQLSVLDRNDQYNAAVVQTTDQASIDAIGLRVAPIVDAPFISLPSVGRLCVELMKNRGLFIRNHYLFKLAWEYALLEPMDIVSLTQSDMGLNNFPVRILTITEDAEGILEIEAEEFLSGVQYAPRYDTQNAENTPISGFTPPTDTLTPIIFEPPYELVKDTGAQIWVAASGATGTWGGCQVWASVDNGVTYTFLDSIQGGAVLGTLTNTLATYGGVNPDATNTLSVDVGTTGILTSVTALDAENLKTLSYVDGELLSFQIANLTGTGLYNLTTLYRGAYSSIISAHASASQFAVLDTSVFKYTMPPNFTTGQVIYIKLPAFNAIGNAVQDLSAVTAIPYTITNVGNQAPLVLNFFVSGVPANNATLYLYIASFAYRLPLDLAGTTLSIGTNPSSTVAFDVKKNGVSFGTISVSSGGAVTLTSTLTSFAIGDTLSIVAPANTYGIANIAFQLLAIKL